MDSRIEEEGSLIRARGALPRGRASARAVIRFAKGKPLGAVGGLIIVFLILTSLLAPVISPFDPNELHSRLIYTPPGGFLPLGGDEMGRDVLSRLFYGGRVSLYVGLVSVAIAISTGSLLGIISAYLGGKFDLLFQRVVDAFMAFPGIILALSIVATLGASVTNVIIALVFVLTPSAARTVRGQALSIKELDYVLAAHAIGSGGWRIILRHIAPNCMAIIIILATIQIGNAIIVEASLSFLGLGVPPETATWGSMLSQAGQGYIEKAPWLAVFPGLAIALAVFGVNLLGDALRDVLDPKLRGQ